jgi:hypothetical protein
MSWPGMASKGSTVSQLREDIDSGRIGDKVDWPNPAAAPLGTDDEAGGNPPHPAALMMWCVGGKRPRPSIPSKTTVRGPRGSKSPL